MSQDSEEHMPLDANSDDEEDADDSLVDLPCRQTTSSEYADKSRLTHSPDEEPLSNPAGSSSELFDSKNDAIF